MLPIKEFGFYLKEKATQQRFFFFQIAGKLKIFYDWPVKYIFDNFDIWLLGYWVEFSCLHIPQWHYVIST